MLYRILYYLFTLTVKGYFRSVYTKGKDNIPQKGPVIFAPNHTSAFMDPILLATEINRPIYFLARGDVFKKKIVARLLGWIHMIPIFRKDDSEDNFSKNAEIFQLCFNHLAKNGTLMIFPEGVSKTERRLRPFKTGTARISLGAEAQNNFSLGIKILPIGINYSNPHHFRSDVFVNFGKPIDVVDFRATYEKDNWSAVLLLTEKLKEELKKRVIVIDDEHLDQIIHKIEILYRSKLRDERNPDEKPPQDFYLSKDIIKAVTYHFRRNPERLKVFERRVSIYLNDLKLLGIRDRQVRSSRISFNLFWSLVYFISGFPLFLYGLLFNYAPYKITELLVNNLNLRDDFIGSVRMAGGMFIFLFIYIVEAVLVGTFTNFGWAVLFIVSVYPAGLFTLNYLKQYFQMRGTLKYLQYFMRKTDLIANLKATRKELIDELEQGRREYLEEIRHEILTTNL